MLHVIKLIFVPILSYAQCRKMGEAVLAHAENKIVQNSSRNLGPALLLPRAISLTLWHHRCQLVFALANGNITFTVALWPPLLFCMIGLKQKLLNQKADDVRDGRDKPTNREHLEPGEPP